MALFDLKLLQPQDYITLACGLGFTVDTVKVGTDAVYLQVSRFDKRTQTRIFKNTSFTFDGFYSPTKQPSMYDVVRVSDSTRTPHATLAGTLDFKIDLMAQLGQECVQRKVRTRNNYWFNVNHIAYDKDTQQFSIKMGNITGDNASSKINQYYNNGKLINTVDSRGSFYSPFDIVEVQVL